MTFAPDGALCAQTDPEAFFPEAREMPDAALEMCRRCPVIDACLAYAIENDERYGVWGGTTARQRQRMRLGVA